MMKRQKKTTPIQTELFDVLQASNGPPLLELMVGRSLELKTAIGELLLNAIDNGKTRTGSDHDA